MRLLEVLVVWFVLGVAILAFAVLASGCGDTYNLGSAAVAPTELTPQPVTTPCLPPGTPAPGHDVRGHTYAVWTSDCRRVQRVTLWTDTAAPGPEWVTPEIPCVRVEDVTPGPCGG